MSSLFSKYNNAWKSIIQPYQYRHNMLFYKNQYLSKNIEIKQFFIWNKRGKRISCVYIKPLNVKKVKYCVFYFHGNGSTKLQTLSFLQFILDQQMAIISFDYIGCGNSDRGYLTYGINQADDAELVFNQTKKYFQYQKLTVWGRSMGVCVAMLFVEKNYKMVDNLVLDSPFRTLKNVILRIIKSKSLIPSPIDLLLYYFLQKQVTQKLSFQNVNFNIFQYDYLKTYKKLSSSFSSTNPIPTYFIYNQTDPMIQKQQILQFFNSTKGFKDILKIPQEHQQDRSHETIGQVLKWIKKQKHKKISKLKLFHNDLGDSVQVEKEKVLMIC